MKVSLSHLGEVEVDDDIDSLDVNTPGEEIAADEVPAEAGSEVVEDPVTVCLGHLGVNVVAGVAELSDLLGQELDSLGGVAEYNALEDRKSVVLLLPITIKADHARENQNLKSLLSVAAFRELSRG